jgi:DNA polymerase-4
MLGRATGRQLHALAHNRDPRPVQPGRRRGSIGAATRSHTLLHATHQTDAILATARGLLAASMPLIEHRGLTLIGVSVTHLEGDDALQLVLPLDGRDRAALDATLDEIRERFGTSAVTRAILVGRHPGLTMPLLPD